MSTNVLATEVVEFVSTGAMEMERTIDEIKRRLAGVAAASAAARAPARALGASIVTALRAPSNALAAFGQHLRLLGGRLSALETFSRRFLLGGGVGLAAIAYGAMKGTQEADNLHKALEVLARVLGDQLAPYVRAVTTATIQLALWWRSLSLETRQSATRWALVGLALAGVMAVTPTLIRTFGALASVAGLLANPFVLIPIVLAAATAALLYLTAEGDTFGEKMESMTNRVIVALFALKAGFRVMAADAADAMKVATGMMDVLRGDKLGGFAKAAVGIGKLGLPDRRGGILAEELAAAADWQNKIKAGVGFLKGLGEGRGFGIKLNVEFESLQGTFDRLQKAFANDDPFNVMQAQLNEQKKAAAELEKANQRLGNIDQKLPVVR